MRRLAILSTHPIQYNAPFFRMLDADPTLKVLVFFSKTSGQVKFDPDFQREIVWDIPVTGGYDHVSHDASTVSGRHTLIGSIRAFAPDSLLVYGWNFPGHLRALRHFHGRIPVWFRGDSHLLDPAPPLKRLARRAFLSWVYRHVDVAFSVGTANEAYYMWCGLKPDQLKRAPHSVEQQHFQNEDQVRKEAAMQWRGELGIPSHADVILFAGKLEEKKQPKLLLHAWEALSDDSHIIIAGSGPLEEELKHSWGSKARVHFIGFQNQKNMPIVYRMANAFCLPSKGPGETWGLSVNEAMACHIRCIVSDRVGCSLDMLRNSKHGKVVPWNQPQLWTTAIRELLQSPPDATDWEPIEKEFDLRHFVKAVRTEMDSVKPA